MWFDDLNGLTINESGLTLNDKKVHSLRDAGHKNPILETDDGCQQNLPRDINRDINLFLTQLSHAHADFVTLGDEKGRQLIARTSDRFGGNCKSLFLRHIDDCSIGRTMLSRSRTPSESDASQWWGSRAADLMWPPVHTRFPTV